MISDKKGDSFFLTIMTWGAFWGIFEVTVGYLLHLFDIKISWLIWYPVACFFMANVYRQTRSRISVLFTGIMCASIKMLNLLTPIRVDKVLNPAISIVFEAVSMYVVLVVLHRFGRETKNKPYIKALAALTMNAGWRLLFIFYLLLLVPDWIRDVSVISSAVKFIPFFITQNFATSFVIFIGYQRIQYVFKPIIYIERKIQLLDAIVPQRTLPMLKTGMVTLLVMTYAALQFIL